MPVTVAAKAPPKKTAATSSAGNSLGRKAQERAEGLTGLGDLVTAGLLFLRQPADAFTIKRHWPTVAEEVVRLGDDNPKIADFLDNINAVGPYAGLITAITPFVLQILVNHDRMPAESVQHLGVVSKATMQSHAQAAIMKAEMEAMQFEMEMQREREAAIAEYRAFQETIMNENDEAVNPSHYAEDLH